ncbi:MAG: helix-turn-helix domain-containing protein, partial [Actinobacteria bacterium]|nr:helix-turn-helix domain-containing protein [Actinomycetota bacterium]
MSIGIGDVLRDAREEQGRSIEDAARDTRVRGDYLRALEDEQFELIGGDVYAKGFLSSYARYLQVDPQPLLDLYRRHVQHDDVSAASIAATPVAKQPAGPPPTWIAWAVVVIVVMVGVAALAQVFGGRTPDPAAGPSRQPSASPSEVTSGTTTPVEPEPSPTPTFDGVNLLITYEDRSWTRVVIDGQTVFEGILERGESREWEDDEEIEVRFGNPAAVRVELNGQSLGAQGDASQ